MIPEVLGNATSLPVQDGQSLRLICDTDGNYPARLSWSQGSLTLCPSQALDPGVLELPRVVLGDGGEFTCRAQDPWGSYHVSVNLVVQAFSCSWPHISGQQGGSWPLVLTLLRGSLMRAAFLLTYSLTWIYYTRHYQKRKRESGADSTSPGTQGPQWLSEHQMFQDRDPRRWTIPGQEDRMSLQLLLLLPVLWGAQDQRYRLELQESVTVQEGLCVFVPCKFSYPRTTFGILHVFWFRKGADRNRDNPVATNKREQKLHESTQGRFFLLGDPQAQNCSLSIRDVNMGDSGSYFFHMEKYFTKHSYLDKMLSLNVTALTHRPDILISGPLESGHPKNLTCSVSWACEWGTPPIFSWTSVALTSLGHRTLLSSVLTLTPRPQDHGTSLTCQVKFPGAGVTLERTIQLNITYAPQNMVISIFQGNSTALKILQDASTLPILEGQAVRLLCVADSNPPAELSWFQGSPALNTTPISTTAILDLPRVETTGGDFTCLAQHPLGSQNVSVSLSVVYLPHLLGSSWSWDDQGLHCVCSSRAQLAPSLHGRLGEGLLEGNSSNASFTVTSSSEGPWANSSLSLSDGLISGLRISCEASYVRGAQGATALLLPGQGSPEG
ncbi:PREDICTED: sialic acid-binding Ig-like lectin 6 [Ceratotherium simum simum]|uniref:Sialic acid-binding Ig-like lectin 6 n=1 Tax=Ceratotherium simum simum TaxID=73337 RepID=A0ABM1DMM2_CERSS|nr:PREDICTED: sialic acid-binding Ig-like lectin 6 [Ceratotherium simum simum]